MANEEQILEEALKKALENVKPEPRPEGEEPEEDVAVQHHEHAVVKSQGVETPNLVPGAVRSS